MAANNILTFSEPWSTDFFDCCGNTKNRKDGWQTCCLTTWCPCVQYGKNVARLQPGEAPCGGNFAGACIGYVAMAYAEWALACLHNIGAPAAKAVGPLMGLQFALHLATRNAIRRKYNLKEHDVGDCLTVTFCAQCAMCQEHYQLTHEEHMGINPHLAYPSGPGPQGIYAAVPQADPAMPPHMAPAQGVPTGNYQPPYAVQGQATAPKGDCCKGV